MNPIILDGIYSINRNIYPNDFTDIFAVQTLCNASNLEMKKVVQNAKKNMVMSAATIKNIPPKKK